eukprot:7778361-Alexandrium_andersonii.AAC.1
MSQSESWDGGESDIALQLGLVGPVPLLHNKLPERLNTRITSPWEQVWRLCAHLPREDHQIALGQFGAGGGRVVRL